MKRIGIFLGALALIVVGIASCGGDDGDDDFPTTITGNLVERTALLAPSTPSADRSAGWLSGLLLGTAWAQSGVAGIQVCLEQCLSGVDDAGGCAETDPLSLCTRTDAAGVFTLNGDFAGDLCVALSDDGDPSFAPRRCMASVENGDLVRLRDMSCLDGDGVCDCDELRIRERDRDRDQDQVGP